MFLPNLMSQNQIPWRQKTNPSLNADTFLKLFHTNYSTPLKGVHSTTWMATKSRTTQTLVILLNHTNAQRLIAINAKLLFVTAHSTRRTLQTTVKKKINTFLVLLWYLPTYSLSSRFIQLHFPPSFSNTTWRLSWTVSQAFTEDLLCCSNVT